MVLALTDSSGGFTVATKTYGGSYGPKHVLAVWVEDSQETFVKTIDVWAAERKSHLTTWATKNAGWKTDTVSGATIGNHTGANGTKSLSWDLKNKAGVAVPDGSYTLVAEMTEANSGSKVARLTVTVSGGSVAAAP